MNITFNQIRLFLSDVKMDFGVDYATLIDHLKKEEWVPQGLRQYVGQENPAFDYRYLIKNHDPQSRLLQSILHYIMSDKVHNQALDILYSFDPNFEGLWGMGKEKMKKFASWHAYYQLDKPGFYLKPHTDYRRLVATGMIYLTEKDDPDLSTYFHWNGDQNNEIRLTTNFGDGWLHVNDAPNIHTGSNNTQEDRYTILLGLTIKHPDD